MNVYNTMKMTRIYSTFVILFLAFCTLIFNSCKTIHETPEGCVVSFIVGAEERNMTRLWDALSPEAQQYYNGLGEKMRKSGKGALENEIARITKFRKVKKEYTVQPDNTNNGIVKIVTVGGPEHVIETVNIDGNYKIKNHQSVKNILDGISAEVKKENGY